MDAFKVVVDTNVLVSALRSNRGASFRLLQRIDDPSLEIYLSVPLYLEYEDVLKRLYCPNKFSENEIDDLLSYVASISIKRKIHFLWRPGLSDPKDDMLLELAVAAGCDAIVTYNTKDFTGSGQFGVKVITPKKLLSIMGAIE